MTTKLTLPCVINLDGLEEAIKIIPELSLADIDVEFVMRRAGADIRCESVTDLKRLVNAWLRRRAKDFNLEPTPKKKL